MRVYEEREVRFDDRGRESHERDRSDETRERRRVRGARSIPDLIRDLRDEATVLIKQQVGLAKVEMNEKVSRVSRNAIYIGTGAAIAYAGLIFLLLAATFGLMLGLIEGGMAQVHALWVAPLIVGFVVALVGYIFVQKGISTLKRESATPRRTARTLREDKRWLEHTMK